MKPISRRMFLQSSTLAALATVTRPSTASIAGVAGPNDRIRVAVVGVRGFGSMLMSSIAKQPDAELAVICDVDHGIGMKQTERAAAMQGGKRPRFEQDFSRVLDDPTVDAVLIATPNHHHAWQSIRAMQAGKHVYVEKSVSHNVMEGRRMVQAARKTNRICQSGTQYRSCPAMIDAMRHLHEGNLGEVHSAHGFCHKRRTSIGAKAAYDIPAGVDYDLWMGPAPFDLPTRPNFHYDWHWQWDFGNGELGNTCAHLTDLARWGLQLTQSPRQVLSYGARFGPEDAGETPNTQVAMYDFGDKSVVMEIHGYQTRGRGRVDVVFYGTGGTMVVGSGVTAAYAHDGTLLRKFPGHPRPDAHVRNFLDAVRDGNPQSLQCDVEQGHLSAVLCHLGNISYRLGEEVSTAYLRNELFNFPTQDKSMETLDRTLDQVQSVGADLQGNPWQLGRRLEFDPATETFRNDAQADALLTRVYREGFWVL